MLQERAAGDRLTPILIAGFTFLLALLMVAIYVSVDAMRASEANAVRLLEQGRATAMLVEAVHRDENSLNELFYELASGGRGVDRKVLLQRLDAIRREVNSNIDAGLKSNAPDRWVNVKSAAEAFMTEGRSVIASGDGATPEFYRRHRQLSEAVAALATAKFTADAAAEHAEQDRSQKRIRYTVILLGGALLVAIGAAALTVYLTNRAFQRARWQSAELGRLSSRAMSDLDSLARRFSRELHDQFGQTLNAIEANLVSIRNSRAYNAGRIEDCLGLIKDGISSVREVSQLLRPSMLDDFGLDASLRWLAEGFGDRTGVNVSYSSNFNGRAPTEVETQFFRIAQEALTNVGRHSAATEVHIEFRRVGDALRLQVSDNGKGFEPDGVEGGLGLVGMRARARTIGGILLINSRPGRGTTINLDAPSEAA